MKINPNVINRFSVAEQVFAECTRHFAEFVKTLDYFSEPRCEVRGVVVTKTDDPLQVIVAYRTVSIRIRMLCELSMEGKASARVVCTQLEPSFAEEKRVVGTFTFNRHGHTDIETSPNEDVVEIGWAASAIVLNFMYLALQQPTT